MGPRADLPSPRATMVPRGRALGIALLVAGLALLLAIPPGGGAPLAGGPTRTPVLPHAGTSAALPASLTSSAAPFVPGLAVGKQVDVASPTLNVRQAPSTSASVLAVEPEYEQGLVLAGSVLADGYTWWEVSFDNNVTGWSAEGRNGTAWINDLTAQTVWFDRISARSYAATYWDVVTSDGYFWDSTSGYVSYPQGTSVVGLSGFDCAHYSSQVIGNESHQMGGGLNIPSRVTPTYGEPGAGHLGDLILSNSWGLQVYGVQSMEPGDLINYEWTNNGGTWDHVAVYIGNGEVSAHTNSHYGANWTLGGAYANRFIHILGTSQGGSGIDHPAVALSLSPSSGPAPLTVTATLTPTGGSTNYPNVLYTWGDGTTTPSSALTATHTYTAQGTYTVDARVTDSLGATGWASNQTATATTGVPPLTVAMTPNPSSGTAPLNVAFTASATGGSGTYTSYAWAFGDGATATTSTVRTSHSYGAQGSYSARVVVTDSSGATASSSPATIIVSSPSPPPLAVSLTPSLSTGSAPLSVAFTAAPSGGSGTYASFAWTFGDGGTQTSTSSSVSHVYANAGSYSATVVVSDGSQTATSNAVVITVSSPSGPPPALLATLASSSPSGVAPFAVQLTLSVSGGTGPYRMAWDYGDGSSAGLLPMTASSATEAHTYAAAGSYVVKATAEDASGTTVARSVALTVSAPAGAPSAPTPSSSPFGLLSSPVAPYALLALVAIVVGLVVAVALARRRGGRGQGPLPEETPSDESAPEMWAPPNYP